MIILSFWFNSVQCFVLKYIWTAYMDNTLCSLVWNMYKMCILSRMPCYAILLGLSITLLLLFTAHQPPQKCPWPLHLYHLWSNISHFQDSIFVDWQLWLCCIWLPSLATTLVFLIFHLCFVSLPFSIMIHFIPSPNLVLSDLYSRVQSLS